MKTSVHGAAGWRLKRGLVELHVTRIGGQIAPVNFDLGDGCVAHPYSLAPWQPDDCDDSIPNLLRYLRGDFFCIPFGVSQNHPHPHGATANLEWRLFDEADDALTLAIDDPVTGAHVSKEIRIEAGHRALYQRHVISRLEGRYNFGHHPILQFPEAAGPCAVTTAPIRFGQVYPGRFEDPAQGGYSALKAGAHFDSLDSVPLANGGTTSLAAYPARAGFEDVVMFSATNAGLGWTAVHFPGYVWIALKNCAELPSTLLWMSNGGRHYPPWNGRHRRRMGVEDVCSYFQEGVEISSEARLHAEGIPTSRTFNRTEPVSIHHIQLVHPLPAGFGTVESVAPVAGQAAIELSNTQGERLSVPVDWSFLSPS
jgi:hypothetical protein